MRDNVRDSRISGTPLFDFLAPCAPSRGKQCLMRARLCSRLAKKVTGTLRRKLYRLKDQNIRAAWLLEPSALLVTVDHHLHHGLLSVAWGADHSVRVHTHENWVA